MERRTVEVVLDGDVSGLNRAFLQGVAGARTLSRELNTSTDRTAMLTQSVLALGPAFVPITASAIPAISGLTNQLAFAAAGAGATALALGGVGDAVKAIEEFRLDPTAASLEKMQETLDKLGPAGRDFAVFINGLRPQLQELQDVAQQQMLPGLTLGIQELLTLAPEVKGVISAVSSAVGTLAAEAGTNLADPRWREFFGFLEAEARPTLIDLGRTLGNFTEGFANLWMAFDPISDSFSDSFLRMSRDFAAWSDGLDQTQGFEDFVAYLDRVGPKAWETLTAFGGAMLSVVEAAAPVGEVALPVIESVADALSAVMDTDAGPVLIGAAAGISAISRAIALYNAASGSAFATLLSGSAFGAAGRAAKDLPKATSAYLDFGAALDTVGPKTGKYATTSQRLGASLGGLAKTGAGLAGLGLIMSDLDNKLGLTNTTMMTMIGAGFGPWGAAAGATVGVVRDLGAATSGLSDGIAAVDAAIVSGNLEQYESALAGLQQQVERTASGEQNIGERLVDFADTAKWTGFGVVVDQFTTSTKEAAAAAEERAGAAGPLREAAQAQKFAEAGLADAMYGTSQATRDQTEELLDNAAAKNKVRDAALDARAAERDLEAAIDDAREAAEENGKTLDRDTEEGRANEEALDGIARAWNKIDDATQVIPGRYDDARASFIEAAILMGKNREAAERMADKYLDVPPDISTSVRLYGAVNATRQARTVRAELMELNGLVSTATIRTMEETYVLPKRQAPGPKNLTELLTGPPKGYANGGRVSGPGTATSDSVLARLSAGEFVVNAFSTSQHLPLLEAINAQKFATGGLVSSVPSQARPMLAAAAGARSAPAVVTASLAGARVAIDPRTNIATFVRGEIRVAMDGEQSYQKADRLAGRKS